MSSWKELATTRKSLMTLVEVFAILLTLGLFGVIIMGKNGLQTQSQVMNAQSHLHIALSQVDQLSPTIDNKNSAMELSDLQSMSSLPKEVIWSKANDALTQFTNEINNNSAIKIALISLIEKQNSTFMALDKEARAMIESNNQTAIAQEVLFAAQTVNNWKSQTIESAFLKETFAKAEEALNKNPTSPLKALWTAWNNAVMDVIEKEDEFKQSKTAVNAKLIAYSIQLQQAHQEWLAQTSFFSKAVAVIFALLLIAIIISLQLIKKNPHINTMFAPKGNLAIQAELAAITEQVDEIMSNVTKTWIDARNEFKVVHHAVMDSEILEEQVHKLKSDVADLIHQISKGLQELEHTTRPNQPIIADQIGHLLGEVQMQSARLQQGMDILADSGLSLHDELAQVQQTIKKLLKETQELKQEGIALEESSDALRSSLG